MNYRPAKICLQREKGGRAGDMVQFLKCLLHKHETQVQIPVCTKGTHSSLHGTGEERQRGDAMESSGHRV